MRVKDSPLSECPVMVAISGTSHPVSARRVSPAIGYHCEMWALVKKCQTGKSPTPSLGSRRQHAEKRLRFRDLGKFRGRRKTLERRREHGMGVGGSVR
jgi:hypothetical protein